MLDIANCGKGDRAKKMNPLLPQIVDQESRDLDPKTTERKRTHGIEEKNKNSSR